MAPTPVLAMLAAMRYLALLLALAACSKDSAAPAPAPAPVEVAPPERTDVIRRGETPLTLVGKTLDVGDAMPDVTLVGAKQVPLLLGTLKGKVIVLSVVPSIDTAVCEAQTHHVSDAMPKMPDAVVITVSRDLPFAQARFKDEAMTQTDFGSDYKGGAFGRAFGVEVKESGLLARSVWVIGKDGKVAYRELVADQAQEPDYDAMVAAVAKAST
jgi:thiol peroxidase